MKKFIGYIFAWTFYGIGDLISKLLRWEAFCFVYPLYNWLMGTSYLIQMWGGDNGPWEKPKDSGDIDPY